jgi:hypothetical protein
MPLVNSVLNLKHGHATTRNRSNEYKIWEHMKARCYRATGDHFEGYGARGITVCDRWLNGENGKTGFECFYEDMGPRPSKKHSINRKDNDGPYHPDNCSWATGKEQQRNTRGNRVVVVDGESMPLVVACERYGANYFLVHNRLSRGWPITRALVELPYGRAAA